MSGQKSLVARLWNPLQTARPRLLRFQLKFAHAVFRPQRAHPEIFCHCFSSRWVLHVSRGHPCFDGDVNWKSSLSAFTVLRAIAHHSNALQN